MAEFDILSKDYIKLNFLNEIVNTNAVKMNVYLEIDGVEKDFLEVRTAGKNAYRFNNFNVSEDATSNCLTFRPIVIGCLAYFKISSSQELRVEVVKNGTNSVAQSFNISAGEAKIEFDPQGTSKYVMKVEQISVETPSAAPETPVAQPVQTGSVSFGSDFGSDFTMGAAPVPEVKLNQSETQTSQQETERSSTPSAVNSFESEFSGFNVAPIPVSQQANTVPASVVPPTPISQPDVAPIPVATPSFTTASSEDLRAKQNELNDLQHSETRINSEISELEVKIAEINDKIQKLADNKKHLVEHMEKLQAEYNKDYSNYEKDVEEIKSKYDIDEEILLMYADKEVVPIEELVERVKADVNQVEEQIRIFIDAQARKTAEIENELKIGKKE